MAGLLTVRRWIHPERSLVVTQSKEQHAQLASLVDFDPGYTGAVPTIRTSMPDLHPALRIDVVAGPDAFLICLHGELDIAGSRPLDLALTEAEESETDRILLDLDALTFTDASGLNVLIRAGHRSARNGNRLWISGGTGQVARMFRLTGLDSTLPFANQPRSSIAETA